MTRCDGWAPTTSTCTRCTMSTGPRHGTRSGRRWRSCAARARSFTSVRRISPAGISLRPRRQYATGLRLAWSVSSPRTTSPRGPSSWRCCPPARDTASGCCPGARCTAGCWAGSCASRRPAGAAPAGGPPRRWPRCDRRLRRMRRSARCGGRRRGRRPGLAAAPARGHRADHRAAHRRAAGRGTARPPDRAGRRGARPPGQDLPRFRRALPGGLCVVSRGRTRAGRHR